MCWWTQLEEHTQIHKVQCEPEPFVARRLSLKLHCTNKCPRNCVQRREKGRRARRAQSREHEGMTCPTEPCQRKLRNNDNHHMCIKTRKMFKRERKKSQGMQTEPRVWPFVHQRGASPRAAAAVRNLQRSQRASSRLDWRGKRLKSPAWRQNSLLALLRCREWSDTGTRKASPG